MGEIKHLQYLARSCSSELLASLRRAVIHKREGRDGSYLSELGVTASYYKNLEKLNNELIKYNAEPVDVWNDLSCEERKALTDALKIIRSE
ncbi:MAG: hypothetical protein DRP15_01870 [Candidatus Aenigmatarchaeota archaeon]|nr:MAG: hypothetical protein DRP15_01870 [Candidatus Aenigmarchaeota archaeon]